MSTKIYDGVRLRVSGLSELHEKINEWRKTVAELQKRHDTRCAAIIATEAIDDAAVKDEVVYGALWGAWMKIEDRRGEVQRTMRRDPAVDTEFSLAILPMTARSTILAIPYCEQRDWVEQFNNLPWVERFPYWDNVDPPSHLSEDQWEMRRYLWDEALSADPLKRPGNCGFGVDCLPTHGGYPILEEAIEFIPPWERRVSRLANPRSFNRWCEAKTLPGETLKSTIYALMREHDLWVEQTDEGRAHYADAVAEIEGKLKRDLSVDDLNQTRPGT